MVGAVHDLLLSGVDHPLREYYPSLAGDAARDPTGSGPVLRDFCPVYEAELDERIRTRLVQTNVVRRAIVLRYAMWAIGRTSRAPIHHRDERGPRSPTGQVRDERYHVPVTLLRGGASWRTDLTLWLHDPHANVTAWHEALRHLITAEQRRAVLRIKDVWHRRPEYPDQVGAMEIYTAVVEDGVCTPEWFAAWLAERGS